MGISIESWTFKSELSEELNRNNHTWNNEVGKEWFQFWLLKKFPEMSLLDLLETSQYLNIEIELERETDYYGENASYSLRVNQGIDYLNLYNFLIQKGYIYADHHSF